MNGGARIKMPRTVNHAQKAAIERPFEARDIPKDCFLDTMRTLRTDVGRRWMGGKLEDAMLWEKMSVVSTESLVI